MRLADVVGALSLASDFGQGQQFAHGLQSTIVAMRLSELLTLADAERRSIFYASLLRAVGCTASAHETAVMLGDDVSFGGRFASTNFPPQREIMRAVLRHVWDVPSLQARAAGLARLAVAMPRMNPAERSSAHCEVAQQLAARLGLDASVRAALGQVFERWDGRGMPNGLRGAALLQEVRILHLAEDAAGSRQLAGSEAAVAYVRERAGRGLDPELVELFDRNAGLLLADLDTLDPWLAALSSEPRPWLHLDGERLEEAFAAVADFADLKSPFTVGHSRGVAVLAAAAAERCRLDSGEQLSIAWSSCLHDLGRTGVPNTIWDKPGPLTAGEWERVRLHTYYTERILSRSDNLAPLGTIAALHHERLDGSGYHRGSNGTALPPSARILATADAYHAMTEERPHRPALSHQSAGEELRRGAQAGRFDSEVANAVLAAAGHRVTRRRRAQPAGLSEREVEVLRLIARGRSNREMAEQLSISKATVGHHIEHIYDKLGCSTRAAATMFALQYGIVGDTTLDA
jgi:HD-GYP domain-containing protein (c-di-GMP phosphodiesterase class II)